MENLNWPLMVNNITEEDRLAVIEFLNTNPILTQNKKVEEFEEAWSKWLGVKYSVFVNSGSSANFITMRIMRSIFDKVILPPITWVSDIASAIENGFDIRFVDVDRQTFGLDFSQIQNKENTLIFVTHVMGLSAFKEDHDTFSKIQLVEDCCECHGATFNGKKLGTFGLVSNFSFYYGHHMTTIEGGMICTDDRMIYEHARMLRGHGMVREIMSKGLKAGIAQSYKNLRPEFIFQERGYNMRSTEINAVIGLSQLRRLDANNEKRKENFALFLNYLDSTKYVTDLRTEGSVNYALTLVTKNRFNQGAIEKLLTDHGVEFRRGLSGGGNQLRQPYLRGRFGEEYVPVAEFLSDNAWYIGNYPDLEKEKILKLCNLLNAL